MPLYGIYRMILEVVGHDQTGGIFRRITSGLASIFQYATAIVGAQIFYRLSEGIASMVSQSIEAVAWFQNLEIALATLVAREMVQTGAAATVSDAFTTATMKAGELAEELSQIAILSPYTVESTTQTYKMAMAFGYTTEEAMTFTKALLNTAAGIGADNSMLDRMAYNLAQVRLQGKVTALDVRQLALAGFDLNAVLKYLGKQMGINIEEYADFNEAIKSGKVTWADFTKYFAQYADEMFGGASERMSRTLFGLKSTFHDVFVLTMPKLLGPAAESVTTFLNKILNRFMAFRESGQLEAWAGDIQLWVERMLLMFEAFFSPDITPTGKLRVALKTLFPTADADAIIKTMQNTWSAITFVWNTGVRIVSEVVENLGEVFAGLQTFWDTYGSQITESVERVVGSFSSEALGGEPTWIDIIFLPLRAFVDWLVANGPTVVSVFDKVATFLGDTFFPAVSRVLTWLSENWPSVLLFVGAFKGAGAILMTAYKAIAAVGLALSILSSPLTLIFGLIGLLAVAWMNDWGGIREKVGAVWGFLQPILEENIPTAVQWLSDVWTTVFQPALQTVYDWLSGTFIPWVSGTLWPWLQTYIPLAIQTVSNFWTGTLLPAISGVWSFLQTYILPVLQSVGDFISSQIGVRVQMVAAIWNGVLVPAFQTAWQFIQSYILPSLQSMADFFGPIIGTAIGIISNAINTVLIPAFNGAWDIINNYVVPVIQVLVDIFGEIAGIVGEAFAGFWENVLFPALDKVYKEFNEHILPILMSVRDFIVEHIGPKIMWFHTEVIAPFVLALQEGLKKALQWFYDILVKIKDFFASFELPDWLQRGSPTPFELSLMGINDQLNTMHRVTLPKVGNALRGLKAGDLLGGVNNVMRAGVNIGEPGTATASSGGDIYITIPVDSMSNEIDIDRLAYKVASTIQRKRAYGQ